ncbi:MAG: glycosyltransferase family 4 protein [Tidjanibacter sp.]|nr:glycosyltransferase family 4 protein [Tidjanibacter sp.]
MKRGGKLLMSCDEYVYCHNGVYYAGSQDKADFYKRYLRVFNRLRLVARCVSKQQIDSNWCALDQRIEFIGLPFYRGPKEYARHFFEVGRILKGVANGCDAALLRLPSTESMRVYQEVKHAKIPYAAEIVYDAYDGFASSNSLIHKLLWLMIDRRMRHICYRADGVSCVTEHYLQRRYFTKKRDGFSSHYSSLALPKSFYGGVRTFPQKEVLTIAHIANQVEYNSRKGHNELIEAIAKLKKGGLIVNVSFVGKDYLGGQARLEELASIKGVENQVNFLGYLDRASLDDFLNNADLYVMPTRAEGLPRVIIEAMAKGLPCISTHVSGNPELLGNHWLVGYDDVDALVERIKELCTNRAIYEATSKENFDNSHKYEASILEKRRDEFYNKLKKSRLGQQQ